MKKKDNNFKHWVKFFESYNLTGTVYYKTLMSFITEEYKIRKGSIFPLRSMNIFNCFRATNYDDLKVVIVGDEPYRNEKATGLAFGIQSLLSSHVGAIPSSLLDIIKCLRAFLIPMSEDFNEDFDMSLEHWAEQGVLLYNSSLMSSSISKNKYNKIWEPFTRRLLQALNKEKSGLIYIFLGRNATKMSKYINNKTNHVLIYTAPGAKEDNDKLKTWYCPHFTRTNALIRSSNGEGTGLEIDWVGNKKVT